MDKKTQKRLALLRDRLERLQRMLAGAKQQSDDPREIPYLEQQLGKAREEFDALAGMATFK